MDEYNYTGMEKPNVTYTKTVSTQQLIATVKIIGFYVFELMFWLIISKLYLNFGSKWIIPSVSAMWVMGAITAYIIREQRESTARETKWVILGYLGFLFLYRGVIQLIAPISSEQMGAALDITIPAASGAAAAGMLQNILLIVSVMTPISFLIWCAQKFKVYNGRATKHETFKRLKGTREKISRI